MVCELSFKAITEKILHCYVTVDDDDGSSAITL